MWLVSGGGSAPYCNHNTSVAHLGCACGGMCRPRTHQCLLIFLTVPVYSGVSATMARCESNVPLKFNLVHGGRSSFLDSMFVMKASHRSTPVQPSSHARSMTKVCTSAFDHISSVCSHFQGLGGAGAFHDIGIAHLKRTNARSINLCRCLLPLALGRSPSRHDLRD